MEPIRSNKDYSAGRRLGDDTLEGARFHFRDAGAFFRGPDRTRQQQPATRHRTRPCTMCSDTLPQRNDPVGAQSAVLPSEIERLPDLRGCLKFASQSERRCVKLRIPDLTR
jgi:hypothetical protein